MSAVVHHEFSNRFDKSDAQGTIDRLNQEIGKLQSVIDRQRSEIETRDLRIEQLERQVGNLLPH